MNPFLNSNNIAIILSSSSNVYEKAFKINHKINNTKKDEQLNLVLNKKINRQREETAQQKFQVIA